MSPRNKLHRRKLPEAFTGQSDVATGFGYGSLRDEDEKDTKTRHSSNRASQVPIAMHLGSTGKNHYYWNCDCPKSYSTYSDFSLLSRNYSQVLIQVMAVLLAIFINLLDSCTFGIILFPPGFGMNFKIICGIKKLKETPKIVLKKKTGHQILTIWSGNVNAAFDYF